MGVPATHTQRPSTHYPPMKPKVVVRRYYCVGAAASCLSQLSSLELVSPGPRQARPDKPPQLSPQITMQLLSTKRFGVYGSESERAVAGVSRTSVPSVHAAPRETTSVNGSNEAAGVDLEALILSELNSSEVIEDSFVFASRHRVDHQALVGTLKSLLTDSYCIEEPLSTTFWTLTEEGKSVVSAGSPEFQVFKAVPAGGIELKILQDQLGEVAKIGLGPCMKNKWLVKKGEVVERLVDVVVDETAQLLAKVDRSQSEFVDGVPEEELKNLKKRKLVLQVSRKSYRISKGLGYKPQRVRKLADLTKDMLGNRSDVTSLLHFYLILKIT